MAPSPEEIEAARTTSGGWTRDQLAKWGVPWPPPSGWRHKLEREWRASQSKKGETVAIEVRSLKKVHFRDPLRPDYAWCGEELIRKFGWPEAKENILPSTDDPGAVTCKGCQGPKVWIDGACAPINPGGTASYGVVVRYGENVLFEKGGIVGTGPAMSNNVAEYSGLIAFLEWYVGRDDKGVPRIHSDSKLLIRQMNGEWRVKQGLYVPYYNRAQALVQGNSLHLNFWLVPREQNEEADKWSKKALLDAGVKLRIQPQLSV